MEEGCGNDWVTPPSDQEMPAVNAEGNGQLELPLRTLGCGSVSPLTLDDNQQYPAPLHSLPATDATFNDQHPIEHATTATLSAHSATNSETPIKQEPCIKEEPRIQQESPIRQEPRIKQESRDPSSSPYPSALKLLRLHARFGSAKKMNNMDTEIKIDAGSGSSTGAAAYNHTGPYGNMDPITIDAAPDTYSQDVSLRGEVTARGRGTVRGRGSARARGMSVPRGRGGIYRATRRTRSQLDDEELEDEDEDATPRRKGKKRQKAGPEPDSYLQPTEIHRRKVSLRDRLIRGEYEPQAVGMRAHMLKKAAAAAAAAEVEAAAAATAPAPPRQFLIPTGPNQDVVEPRPMASNQVTMNTQPTIGYVSLPTIFQLGRPIAYKSTPVHQLHFPEALILALKQNDTKWKAKKHSDAAVFVVNRVVGAEVMDIRVFSTLRDATVDALHTIVNEHPEAFAAPLEKDGEGNDVKVERSESAYSVIRQLTARPDFEQVQLRVSDMDLDNNDNNNGGGATHPATGDIDAAGLFDEDEGEESLFVIKAEDAERPRPPRILDARPEMNERGEILLGPTPEPTYIFWGDFKIQSYGLKMEARRGDGASVKVSVHLKNLRKPVYT